MTQGPALLAPYTLCVLMDHSSMLAAVEKSGEYAGVKSRVCAQHCPPVLISRAACVMDRLTACRKVFFGLRVVVTGLRLTKAVEEGANAAAVAHLQRGAPVRTYHIRQPCGVVSVLATAALSP